MEDRKIVELYHARDESAIAETNRKYGRYCHAIAYRILQNDRDSEECVSDTWLRAWDSMPPKKPDVLSVFLGRITRNLSLDRVKLLMASKRGGGLREIRFHDTRHSSGSALCQMGVSMKEIQEWLGHSDFSTTANIYSHLTSDTKVRTAESMMKTLGMTENKESA